MKHFKLVYTAGVILLSVLLTLGIASLILAVLGADVLKTFWVIFCLSLIHISEPTRPY